MVYKQGNIVTITYPNDVQGNIPCGEIGVIFTLPTEYHPKYSVIAFTGYGNDITNLIPERFTLTYLTA